MRGRFLETMTWPEAEEALKQFRCVVIPVGARCKEHGLHLPLNTDWLTAEALTAALLERCAVMAIPTIAYGYYPAFVEYPGSITLARETFRSQVCEICRSLHRHGAERFYLLNTGISTNWSLEPARLDLQREQIIMEYTDLRSMLTDLEEQVQSQDRGSHADEIETSVLLHLHPEVVRFDRALKDANPRKGPGPLTRVPDSETGIYSPTGAWGDPTLASPEKGRIVFEEWVERIVQQIEEVKREDYTPCPPREEYLR